MAGFIIVFILGLIVGFEIGRRIVLKSLGSVEYRNRLNSIKSRRRL